MTAHFRYRADVRSQSTRTTLSSTGCYNHARMVDILDSLLTRAEERFGPERALDLKPFLEEVAADLAALDEFPLDPEDEA